MKNFKRMVGLILCLSLMLSVPLTVSAASLDNSEDEYIEFVTDNKRLTSNGDFEFHIRQYVRTSDFTALSNTLRIDTSAMVKDTQNNTKHTDPSVKFRVELFKASTNDRVGYYEGYANDIYGGRNFTVVNGAKYYIKVTSLGGLYSTEILDGIGRVSPISTK